MRNELRRTVLTVVLACGAAALWSATPAMADSRGYEVENQGTGLAILDHVAPVEREICQREKCDQPTYAMEFEGRPKDGSWLAHDRLDRWELKYKAGHIYGAKITYRIWKTDVKVQYTIVTSTFSNDSTCRVIPANAGHCVAEGRRLEMNVPAPPAQAQAAAAQAGPGTGIAPGTRFTPLAASTLTRPAAVRGSDGRRHIAYELELTNASNLSATVQRVQVRAPGVRRALADISGDALVADMTRPGGLPPDAPASDSTVIGSSSVAIVWLDVIVPRGQPVPRELEHHVSATLASPTPFQFSGSLGTVRTARRAPVRLAPPLKGGTWVADEGCCAAPTHHRRGLAPINGQLLVPQRFAIDWAMLDSQGRAWVGDPNKLTSYPGYGQPEIAAARGVVVSSVDGIKDNTPQGTLEDLPTITETVGNHVILRIAPNRFLLYGHMKRGSVRVKVGQRVRVGQLLGQVGNSGNSSTPHLHFQVLTQPTFFPSDSVPFTFRRFTVLGQAEPFTDEDLALRPTGTIKVTPTRADGVRHDELPLDLSVLRFRGR